MASNPVLMIEANHLVQAKWMDCEEKKKMANQWAQYPHHSILLWLQHAIKLIDSI